MMNSNRRNFVKTVGAFAGAMAVPQLVRANQASDEPIKIGWAISNTGPFSAAANATQIPNYKLWIADVNAAGGINVGGKKRLIQAIEYDDRSQPEEAVRAVVRLINQDKVDFILPPWGTGQNMAVAASLARHHYPHIAPSFITERMPELVKRWNNLFALLQPSAPYGQAIVDVLKGMREAKTIGNRVAVVNVTDQGGIELFKAAREALAQANFDVVYEAGYPIGSQDLNPIIAAAQQSQPDAFLAFSYPPDTLALTEAAKVRNFNPHVFYLGVGTALPLYLQKFGASAQGVMGPGGWNPDTPAIQDYIKRHQAMTGTLPDHWVSYLSYSGLQALQQAIEKAGSLDRQEIIKILGTETFDTLSGPLRFENNIASNAWLVGQWQGDTFRGVAPQREGVSPIITKPKWN